MNAPSARPRIVLITDPAFGDDPIVRCVEIVAAALPPGVLCVQLRDKQRATPSLRLMATRLRIATRRAGALLVINGNASVARDVGADGVHLGRGAGPVSAARQVVGRPTWVSVAAHDDEDVRRAVDEGADAALVSPIFPTRPPSTSLHGDRTQLRVRAAQEAQASTEKTPRGLDALKAARALAGSRMMIVALGGVTVDRVRPCVAAGADGVAVLRALLVSPDPASVARAIHDVLAPRW